MSCDLLLCVPTGPPDHVEVNDPCDPGGSTNSTSLCDPIPTSPVGADGKTTIILSIYCFILS